MSKKLILTLLSLLLVAALVAGCGGGESAEPEEGAKPYIPVISKGFQHQFWQAVKQGAEQAATELNVDITFEGPESEAMVDKQVEMFQTALDKNPAAICLAAVDSKAFGPLLEQAKEKGIPVVGFDSGVDSDIPVTTAATDNIAAAAMAADKMAELIGGAGEVAVIAHDQTSRTGIERVKGFTDQINGKYPDVKIVDTQYGGGDQLKATDLAKAIIQANPNLKGFYGANSQGQADLMDAGTLKILMSIPITPAEFSLHYSGVLSAMDLTRIDAFLEIAEHTRIKSGSAQEAAFEIDVTAGQAHGRVHAIYKGLEIALLDKQTGSEKGFDNRVASFFANVLKVRNANAPGASGSMKQGKIDYTRKPDDEFLQFVWFALRTGVLDVISL